jgi:hypothetical protein
MSSLRMICVLLAPAILGGCVVAARPAYGPPACAGGVWIVGHYGPRGVWHPGHWRCPGVVERVEVE